MTQKKICLFTVNSTLHRQRKTKQKKQKQNKTRKVLYLRTETVEKFKLFAITLIGETFAGETFARGKTRENFWMNFHELTNTQNFAK